MNISRVFWGARHHRDITLHYIEEQGLIDELIEAAKADRLWWGAIGDACGASLVSAIWKWGREHPSDSLTGQTLVEMTEETIMEALKAIIDKHNETIWQDIQ